MPTHNDIYPSGPNKNIKINKFSKELCGKFRPKHFESIVDVVERFVKIINPKRIYFGQKDFQQLLLVEDYIKKNLIKTKVIKCKTIREKTGLAYSSRNMLLTKKEKLTASKVFKFFKKNKSYIFKNNISINKKST